MTYTKEMLKQQLREMGIVRGDSVLIHTSYKAVGEIEGGPDALLDAFCEYLEDGLFLVPTHTWGVVNRQNTIYNVRESVPNIGLLPRIAARRSDGVRSLHPTHSIWGHGRDAAEFLRGEEFAETPAPVGGAWCRLGERGAKILLVGVGLNRHTFIHAVDEIAALDDRLSEHVWEVTVVDAEGQRITHPYRGHGKTGSEFFGKFEEMLTVGGAIGQGRLGDAEVKVVDAQLCRDILLRFYARTTENYCLMEGPIPRELWEDLV
jgi:aminoglycoside 3-N-acetyltransferase